MTEKLATRSFIPPPIQTLTLKELHILTVIPLYLLEGFMNGEFRPRPAHRERLSVISLPFYKWNAQDRKLFLQRKKYRAVAPFLTEREKDELSSDAAKYEKRINALVSVHWSHVMKRLAERAK